MKRQRHKHKESFSILLISHTNGGSRQYHISLLTVRLLLFGLCFLCAVILLLILQSAMGHREEEALRAQLLSQQQMSEQLEAEKEALNNEIATLSRSNELQRMDEMAQAADGDAADSEEEDKDSTLPGLYPSSDSGMVISAYTEEEPYLSINTHLEDKIIAAGDGAVVTVTSDDTYPVIVEIQHESGYLTRYLCRQSAQLQTEENAVVLAGDTLFVITSDDTQLDYQVIFGGEPIDPLNVIDAKG